MNIGILGGTFDPIHFGHLIIAEEARMRLQLAEVIFVPAGQPWLKEDRVLSPAHHRTEMVSLAIASNPLFKLSMVELERAGVSYTVDTMAILHSLNPKAELYFILGWDSITELPLWKEPACLIQMCQLVAVPRLGFAPPDLSSLELTICGISQRVILLDMMPIGISSSDIRYRLAHGLSIHYRVPQAVESYIQEQGLYLGVK